MEFFSLIAEFGGLDSEAAAEEHFFALRKGFGRLKRRKYSKDIDQIRLVLCIGGKLRDFDLPAGVARLVQVMPLGGG
jgi:hypothetical protein